MLITAPSLILIGIGFCVLLAILAVVVLAMIINGREAAKNPSKKALMQQVAERKDKMDNTTV